MLSIELPLSPSVNNYWRMRVAGKRPIMYLTAKAKEYREIVKERTKGIKTRTGDLAIMIDVYPPDKRRRDIDNILKSLFDALEHAKVYENDNQIREIIGYKWHDDKPIKGGRVNVKIFPLTKIS